MSPSRSITLAIIALTSLPAPSLSAENCSTALSRIAQRAVEDAIAKHRDDACAGVKAGPLAVDKTKMVELSSFRLCEDGPVVSGAVVVHVECATSEQAVIKTTISDDITAVASANLDTCQVLEASITATKGGLKAILSVAGASRSLREGALKEIKPYCKR